MSSKILPKFFFRFLSFLVIGISVLFLVPPQASQAKVDLFEDKNGSEIKRSLENLKDLDSQTWQLIAYPEVGSKDQLILRIVGFTGSLRLNHPTNLEVISGLKSWTLKDITLKNPELANDYRDAAVEFLLQPLLMDLQNNRPLRFFLEGGFNELPIPPYLVNEWRSLQKALSQNEG